MPFEKVNVNYTITDILTADPELKQMWGESRTEYRIVGELTKLRKDKGLSQAGFRYSIFAKKLIINIKKQ